MNKKIALLATIIILIAITIGFLVQDNPDRQLEKSIEENNKSVGPLEIEEEFVGPNTNYSRQPSTDINELNLNF
jgi:hypothetical protein